MKIAFYAAQSGKTWNGETLEREALGGSETAVIYVARELARLGHEVAVFTRAEPGVFDGVVYLPFERARNILRTTPFDALVCSRDLMPMTWARLVGVTVFWHHDLPQHKPPFDPDLHAFVSAWQANVYVNASLVDKSKVRVLANGIDLGLFGQTHEPRALTTMHTPKLVWTSNPERGLWHAGTILQEVRKTYPNAELHVYGRNAVYGWDTGGERNYLPTPLTGVVLHDALPKAQLAHALKDADLFIYPTWWPETYCIAAVEAQAAGLPVVASQYGALTETVRGGLLVPGYAGVEGHLSAFADGVTQLLGRLDLRTQMSVRGRNYATTQDWKLRGEEWSRLLTSATMGG